MTLEDDVSHPSSQAALERLTVERAPSGQFRHTLGGVGDYEETANMGTFLMLCLTFLLIVLYLLMGPTITKNTANNSENMESE